MFGIFSIFGMSSRSLVCFVCLIFLVFPLCLWYSHILMCIGNTYSFLIFLCISNTEKYTRTVLVSGDTRSQRWFLFFFQVAGALSLYAS